MCIYLGTKGPLRKVEIFKLVNTVGEMLRSMLLPHFLFKAIKKQRRWWQKTAFATVTPQTVLRAKVQTLSRELIFNFSSPKDQNPITDITWFITHLDIHSVKGKW